jgi:L-ascorbate metabolism protein UlaG (beta-lactamase superfamily)
VDITWIGHACLRIRAQGAALVMDPVDREHGYDMGRPQADIVTVSISDPAHSHVRGVRGEPMLLDAPGEYEVKGVQVLGVATQLRPPVNGERPPRNIVFVLEADDLRLAHLGGLGSKLTAEQAEQLGSVDVLVLPVGGEPALEATEAARLVREIEPRAVIPIHYQPDENGLPPQEFLKAVGLEPEAPVQRLSLQSRGLGDKTRLLLLEARG